MATLPADEAALEQSSASADADETAPEKALEQSGASADADETAPEKVSATADALNPACAQCGGLLYCGSCQRPCGYLRAQPECKHSRKCECEGKGCSCLPALQYPVITEWFWEGGAKVAHHTQVHGAVHFPPGTVARPPRLLENHHPISTSQIRHVLSVQYSLVRTFSGSIYQLHAISRNSNCRALAQRDIVVPLDLLYLNRLLQLGRAQLHDEAPLAAWWRLPSALFAVVVQHILPYVVLT